MVEVRSGQHTISREKERISSIIEFVFDGHLRLVVFPGRISPNDIWIKYIDSNTSGRMRTPKHIHWVLDILVKREHNRDLVNDFLKKMLNRWEEIKPLPDREYTTIKDNLVFSMDENFVSKYRALDSFGFWPMDFITFLIELLMIQEKTNNPNAYMFPKVVKNILEGNDPYRIVSDATMGGGRR